MVFIYEFDDFIPNGYAFGLLRVRLAFEGSQYLELLHYMSCVFL